MGEKKFVKKSKINKKCGKIIKRTVFKSIIL